MKKVNVSVFVVFITYSLVSCSSTKNISGIYYSKFAVYGFFGTQINLNKDSTFGYRRSGDLMFDTSNGSYKVDSRYVILYHVPFKPDTSQYEKYGKEPMVLSYVLFTNKHLKQPERYVAGHNKLFVCDSSGNIIRRVFGYSKHRRYLIFGRHWYKQLYFLRRVA